MYRTGFGKKVPTMKSVAVYLAFFGLASADYVNIQSYVTSTTCEGESLFSMSTTIDCETSGATSYKVLCDNSTSAQLLTFADSSNCTGPATYSQNYPADFGCSLDGSGTSTNFMTCVSGACTSFFPDSAFTD
jgi:hypothetical protein